MVDEMSTELVVPTQGSKKKLLVSQEAAEFWVSDVSKGKELFTSVIPTLNAEQVAYASRGGTSANAIVTFVFGLAGSGMADLLVFMPMQGDQPNLAITGMALASLLVPITAVSAVAAFINKRHHRWGEKWWKVIHTVQSTGLRAWLKARYGVRVDDEGLASLASQVLEGKEHAFTDTSGKTWLMRPVNAESASPQWLVEKKQNATASEAEVVDVNIDAVKPLPKKAKALYANIVAQVETLNSYPLTVESSHAVRRSEQEAEEIIASYRKLEALNARNAGDAALVEVLSAINDELGDVAQHEVAAVRKQMAVQSNYLQDKKATKGSPTLALTAQSEQPLKVKESGN